MTALERKHNTEIVLKQFNIVLNDQLPPLEEEADIVMKSPGEIAERIVVLTYLSCAGQQEHLREDIIEFLKSEKIWQSVSEQEKELFTKTELSDDDKTVIAWRSEAILFLLWTINKIESLSLPAEEVDMNEMFQVLPGFFESTEKFISSASVRSASEILDQADFAFRFQWAARETDLNSETGLSSFPFNPGILYERYHAVNWVTGIEGEWE
jgi:hypothetical protein